MDPAYKMGLDAFTKPPMTKQEHRRVKTGAVVAAILAIILGAAYWWTIASKPAVIEQSDVEVERRAQILDVLNKSTYEPTPEELKRISDALSQSTYTPSESSKAKIVEQLNNAK